MRYFIRFHDSYIMRSEFSSFHISSNVFRISLCNSSLHISFPKVWTNFLSLIRKFNYWWSTSFLVLVGTAWINERIDISFLFMEIINIFASLTFHIRRNLHILRWSNDSTFRLKCLNIYYFFSFDRFWP
jgi:hypothetical protein